MNSPEQGGSQILVNIFNNNDLGLMKSMNSKEIKLDYLLTADGGLNPPTFFLQVHIKYSFSVLNSSS